jgi:hypothetical protein
LESAGHLALSEHVPGLPKIVTVCRERKQAPEAVMVGVVLAGLEADTTNVEFKAPLAGAPVKLTVGAICWALTD